MMITCGRAGISTEFQNSFLTSGDYTAFQNTDLGKKIRNNNFSVFMPAFVFPFWILNHRLTFQLCGFCFVLFFDEMKFELRSLNGT